MADLFDDLKIDPAGNSGSKQASTDLFDDLGINPTPKQNTSLIGDLGTDLKRGLQQIPGAATGFVDLVVGGLTGERYASKAADALGEATGFQPSKWAEEARAEYSPQRQAAEAEIDQAWEEGTATDIAGAYLRNPGRVAGLVAESLPSMVAGGLAGRAGLAAGRASGALARPATAAQAARQAVAGGAAGEGAVIAGQTMDQIDDSVDARRAAAAAAGAGALGGALGYAGGRVAQRMGLADAETMIAGGARAAGDGPPRGLVRRMLGGAMSEGAFEELPQSVQQQMLQNWAEGLPLMEGVARSAVEGTLAGSAMGAAANVMPARRGADGNGQAGQQTDGEVAGLLPAPVSTGTPNEQILQAEVERENEVAAAEARAAEIYRQRAEFDAQRLAAPLPSEQMGLDPNAGPMSAAAALAVDSGASQPVMDQHQPVERARDQVPPPAGSFSAMNEFADLLEQEGQDVVSRRDRIADVQSQRREFEFEEADRRTAEAMRREAQARRRDVLDAVLEDPETANPAERFAAMLGRLGFRESTPTAEELQTIRRFQDVRAAQPATPEIEPSAPNELDAEAVGIRERRPKALQTAATVEPSATAPTTQPAEDQPASASLTREAGQVNETPVSLTNAGSRWASMSTADRQAAAERAGLNPIQRRNVPDRPWRQLSAGLQERLVQAMGSLQSQAADNQIEGNPNGAIPAQRTDAAVAAPGAAQAGADVAGSAGAAPQQSDVPAVGELEPAARGPVAGGRADQPAGDTNAGRAAVRPGDGSPVGQALSVLLDRTDGNGSPDGLSGPEHADARTAIVAAITGQSAAEIEAAPNFKFRTSVPQVERLLYDAVGVPAAGNLKDRRGPFLDWLDGATGQQAAAVEATGEVVSERDGEDGPQFSFAGEQTADAMAMPEQPARTTSRRRAPKIDEAGLIRAMELQFPSLVKPVRQMLDRGKQGQRGGLVLIDSANPEKIAQAFASTTGRSMDSAVEAIGEHGAILGFFDPRSGMTFMVGPRLNPVTAPAVLLHEAMHGKQRAAIDAKALSLIENRRRQPARPLRQFLDGVAARMEDAGEAGNAIEASTYIVEQAVIAGRQAGFSAVDGRLLNWIDANIGKQVGNLVREFVAMIRAWGLRLNAGVVTPTVDDLVALAQLNLRDMGRGDVVGRGGRAAASLSAERTPKLRAATNFLQARQAAREFQGKELTNSATGMTAVVSRNSLDKMLSGKAVSKSETPATHAMAVANADKLFEHAVLGWSKPDRASDPSIVAIHRFFAPMDVGGRTKLVKLTVKETAQASDANPLYTVEAVEFNENMPGREWLEAAAQEDGVSLETENPLQRGVGGREGQRADPRPTLAQPRGNAPGRSAEDVLSLVLSSDASKAANDTLAATQRRADSSDASMGAGDSSNVPSPPGNNKPRDDGDGDIRFSRAGRAIDAAGAAIDRARNVKRKITGKDAGPTAAQTFNDLDAEQQQYLGKIGSRRAPAADAIRSALDRAALKIRQGMVDRYAALKELDEKLHGKDFINSSITDSSWVLAKMSSAASGALNAMMSTGRIVFDGAQRVIAMKDGDATGGLTAVLHQLGSPAEVERFFGWVAANRAEKLMAEGREHLFSPEEIAAGKRMNAGKTAEGKVRPMLYAKVFKEFQQYRDDVLAIAEQTGTISEENRAMWRDEFYVPFYRVMEEEGGAKGPRAGKGLSRQEAYKKLKGGRENLNDLLENTLMNFHHLLSASLKNQAAAQAIKNAEKLGIARKVPESNRDTDTSTFVLEKGRRVFYQVDDPLVFEAITSLSDPGLNNFAVRAMSAFKRTFTNMTTITPQFVIANTLRDLMQATATSPMSKNALKNVAQGLKTFTNDKTRAEMLASGGAFSFGHIYGMDADEVRASLRQTVKGAQLVSDPSMIPQILRQGWRKWNQITDVSENMTRAATYAQNVEEMGRLRAAFEARDVMDFSQHGAWPAVRFLIRVVPFLNARLQGLDKLYRSGVRPALMTAMGKGTVSDKQAAARFATVTGALTLASLALYMANADDDEYQKLEEWQKDTYWFFRIGDNAFFLPKPFEVGSIATMAERVAQQFMDDKATGKLFRERMWEMLMQTFAFNPTPQVFQPVIDVYSNKDAFTGRDIETAGMDRLSVGLRARDTTTAAGRALSAASRVFGDETPLAVSPVQADHLIRGYLGSVGATGAGMIDTIWRTATGEEAPDKRWSEYQPIRRFYRDLGAPAPYTRYSTLFYEGLRESNRIYADVMELQKLGRGEDAGALREKHRNVLAMRQTLNREQRRLSDINQQMQAVRRSDRDGEWKRREIDRLNTLKNAITERQGKRVEEMRAAG